MTFSRWRKKVLNEDEDHDDQQFYFRMKIKPGDHLNRFNKEIFSRLKGNNLQIKKIIAVVRPNPNPYEILNRNLKFEI